MYVPINMLIYAVEVILTIYTKSRHKHDVEIHIYNLYHVLRNEIAR